MPGHDQPRRLPRFGRADGLAIAGLLLLGVALPLLIGLISGSIGVPRNDDWVYRRIALDYARTGVLVIGVRTMTIGQVLVVQPLLWLSGLETWAFTATGIVFASTGVLSTYALARQFLRPRLAALPVLLLLLFPGYLAYATSFMTDVPAITTQMACLAIGAAALRRRPVPDRMLLAAIVVGCLGVSFRDFAIAAPAAIAAAALCVAPRRRRYWALAATVVGWYGVLYAVRVALYPAGSVAGPPSGGLLQVLLATASLSLVLAPAVLIATARWRPNLRRFDVLVGAEVGLLLAASRILAWSADGWTPLVLLPNLLSQIGATGDDVFLGHRPLLFGDAAWAGISLLALAASVILLATLSGTLGASVRTNGRSLGSLMDRLGSPTGLVAMFALFVVGGLVAYGIANPLLDRYLWPLAPAIGILVLHPGAVPNPRSQLVTRRSVVAIGAATGSLIAILGSLSLVLALNSSAFDVALWSSGETLASDGVRADELEAGYSWVGYHATAPATGGGTGRVFYQAFWPDFRTCGLVTTSMAPGMAADLVGTVTYRLYLVAGPTEPLYLFKSTNPDCQ